MSSRPFLDFADRSGGYDADQRSRRANRRRLIVFLSVFVVLSLIGLVYDFSRPALYRSVALLNFVPVTGQPTDDPTRPSEKAFSLRDEAQYLGSRTLLAKVWDGLNDASGVPSAVRTADPPATLQSMMTVQQVNNTNIVSVRAEGHDPAFLAMLVDSVVAKYRESLGERFRSGSVDALAEAREEVRKLEASVNAKRQEVDTFRTRNNIVSLERDENQVLSEVKGTGASLNAANEKVVAAEARLGALIAAEASGQASVRPKDNSTLAALEQQAASIRADLREVARTFTEQYMAIDPRVRASRARLAEIEEQIVVQRKASQQGALQEARDEVASARAAVAALRGQLAGNQGSVQSFTSKFGEYKGLQEQLSHLETLRQKAGDRLATLEAGERGRTPKVELVEPAAVPQSPSSPLYVRDAALVLIAALIAGLLTMGIVEFFNRPPAQPATVVVPQTWSMPGGPVQVGPGSMALPGAPSYEALSSASRTVALPAPLTLPRELTDAEIEALLAAADHEVRLAAGLILSGLTAAEVVGLRGGDVERETGIVRVAGAAERAVAVAPGLLDLPDTLAAEAPLVHAGSGRPMSEADLETALLYAAHDAGIDEADEVTSQALRHTYVAFLLRQGMRFADLAKIVGPLPADRLSDYRRLSPGAASRHADGLERVLPSVLRSRG